MGRKKQACPIRSRGTSSILTAEGNNEKGGNSESIDKDKVDGTQNSANHYFVEVDQNNLFGEEHFDIAEVILSDIQFGGEFLGFNSTEDILGNANACLRFRLSSLHQDSLRLGHWPVMTAADICLELFTLDTGQQEGEKIKVLCSGRFDGPDEGVSGLAHLVSQKLMAMRAVPKITPQGGGPSICLRIEILKSAFDACESLLDTARKPWKKSMMAVMAWLRPEVTTEEAKYGFKQIQEAKYTASENNSVTACNSSSKLVRFDVAQFYEAIKPSKKEPMLENGLFDLLPQLRPYQLRAAYWMVQQEKKDPQCLLDKDQNQFTRPFCVPVGILDSHSKLFYNPFSGNCSMHPQSSSSHISGGILADEMGLGKTVELLACIFARRKSTSEVAIISENETTEMGMQKVAMKRLKRERIECICGATTESPKYKGIWVQCDVCDAWQHADCVDFSTEGKRSRCIEVSDGIVKQASVTPGKRSKRKNDTKIVEMEGLHICSACSDLIQIAKSTIITGATLIVCPAPILPQWHDEIIRHTRPGSLKTHVYEGVKNQISSAASKLCMDELASADIVLTTYDVLREDLSHDTDRYEGDRRFLRFQKRYPVVPTPLTRIFWWRICLDEAQMVESNSAAATEMALRLNAKHRWCITGTPIQRRLDDLYGLLRFLSFSPFNVHRWWIDAIRDPYEKGHEGAVQFTHNLFKQIMWRSSKADVSDELQLPLQEEWVSWLTFSQIEAHFYQRQHETCLTSVHKIISGIKDSRGTDALSALLDDQEAAKLLSSLLKLRQACCHPQVGSSGLRSLQQSPMSMDEILEVLISKAKTEGEEALRKVVVALNGLAAIAAIEHEFSSAVLIYKEALALSEEHSDDFRLDPLLDLHIHHNLAELLPAAMQQTSSVKEQICRELTEQGKLEGHPEKRQKLSVDCSPSLVSGDTQLEPNEKLFRSNTPLSAGDLDVEKHASCEFPALLSDRPCTDGYLRNACEKIKEKYLSAFISKLALAQQEFNTAHMQVCNELTEGKGQVVKWWLQALDLIEEDNDASNELIRKIDEAVSSGVNGCKSSRIASRFRTMTGLKYLIQTSLDQLETSRQVLVERLMEIDKTMESPREEDVVRVSNCQNCKANIGGPTCVICELSDLLQLYQSRLFRFTKGGQGGLVASEEVVDIRKSKSSLNRFFVALSQPNRNSVASEIDQEESRRKRDIRTSILETRAPSELEIILTVVKNHSKPLLGRECMSLARRHLFLFEAMRKEIAQATRLLIAQSHILNAYDEIKMATSRLRLRENDTDASALSVGSEELVAANMQNSNEKFISLSLLSSVRGKLRYLKGLALSEKKVQVVRPNSTNTEACTVSKNGEGSTIVEFEACPVCQEKLHKQKMVFQCGHLTCFRCLVAMAERAFVNGKARWIMCPTCRQRTEYGNIGYVDDRQNKAFNSVIPDALQQLGISEISLHIEGSYGTKIEAVTRRILWISSTYPEAKVIVFSSWNDVLDVLEHAFNANKITYIRMKGGRKSHSAISRFKGQERTGKEHAALAAPNAVQVLLLLVQHGANGLNLLEAQHVVLVEPLLNPAAEAQAVNRVHRIGQEKATFVHRFIVKDTVEESIYKLNRSRTAKPIISGNTKNKDQLVLTLKDVESLFSAAWGPKYEEEPIVPKQPASVAAALAAEKRLNEKNSQNR